MASLSFNVLRIRDFRFLMAGRMAVIMALQAQSVIVGWQVYSLTKDPFMLGLTGLVEAAPAILCALFAGHIVDISRPHRIYMLCVFVLMLNTFSLFLIAGGIVTPPGGSILPWLFAGVFISGLARSFIMPSSFALFPQIVPRKDTVAASAWMSSGFQFSAILGPALAGFIYGIYGAQISWLMPVGLIIVTFIMISAISHSPRSYRSKSMREPTVKSIKAGWKFILKNPIILSVMTLDMFAVLLGGAVSMLPAYADQVLHMGSQGSGILRASPAIGAIFTALVLAIRPFKRIRGSTLLIVVAGFGVCMIGFGLSTHFWLSMIFLILSGAFDSVSMITRSTIMQLLTPDSMRGRVSSVNSMFVISSNELGAFESGLAAKVFGLVPSVVLGGIGTLLVVAVTAIVSPGLRYAVVESDNEKGEELPEPSKNTLYNSAP
jgi:MFS family permease